MATDNDKTLMDAIKANDEGAVEKALAQSAKAGGKDDDGDPLLAAALNGNLVIAGILVASGADIHLSEKLARRRQDTFFNWGDDPVNLDFERDYFERDYIAYQKARDWLAEQRQEITERAVTILGKRVAQFEGIERQLAELREAVDAIVNPKAIDKAKLTIPKMNITP